MAVATVQVSVQVTTAVAVDGSQQAAADAAKTTGRRRGAIFMRWNG
jgi:hypothetical protein